MGGEFNNRIDSGIRSIYINIYTHNMSPSHRNGFNVLNLPLRYGQYHRWMQLTVWTGGYSLLYRQVDTAYCIDRWMELTV